VTLDSDDDDGGGSGGDGGGDDGGGDVMVMIFLHVLCIFCKYRLCKSSTVTTVNLSAVKTNMYFLLLCFFLHDTI